MTGLLDETQARAEGLGVFRHQCIDVFHFLGSTPRLLLELVQLDQLVVLEALRLAVLSLAINELLLQFGERARHRQAFGLDLLARIREIGERLLQIRGRAGGHRRQILRVSA